jgi:hypothetical protein
MEPWPDCPAKGVGCGTAQDNASSSPDGHGPGHGAGADQCARSHKDEPGWKKNIDDEQAAREADKQEDRSSPDARKVKFSDQFRHALMIHHAAPS